MRSTNPALRPVLDEAGASTYSPSGISEASASYRGVGLKAAVVLAVAVLSAAALWPVLAASPGLLLPLSLAAMVGALVCVVVAHKAPRVAPAMALLFGAVEGVFLSGITLFTAQQFGSGIVVQAVLITAFVFVVMLTLYSSGLLKVTRRFRNAIFAATLGVALFYGAALLGAAFGFQMPLIWSDSPLGIAFTAAMCVLAALGLAVDFDDAAAIVEMRAPASAEWGVAIGLVSSIVWLYIEILRLLSKLQSR